ncbi:nitrogenase component 1 [Candidatus Methanoliparum sp. LAM-1]|nr:nitrogenase component 1 [Candidatus Methanoliparum sp. LAM-1]
MFGGRDNLVEGIHNLVYRYQPEIISIVTVCSSEIIGDDYTELFRRCEK